MTKAELIARISEQTGVDKVTALAVVESFMDNVKGSLINSEENVYLRGFGSFIVKEMRKRPVVTYLRILRLLSLPTMYRCLNRQRNFWRTWQRNQ